MIKPRKDLISYRKLATCMDEATFERNHSTFRWTNSPYYVFMYMYKIYSNGQTAFIIKPRELLNAKKMSLL